MKQLMMILCFLSLKAISGTVTIAVPLTKDIHPNTQLAYNAAKPNDTIYFPQGQFEFKGKIVVTKPVTFIGKGIKNTILYRPESMTDIQCDAIYAMLECYAPAKPNIQNICFKSKRASEHPGDGFSMSIDRAIEITNCPGFIIKNCRFENWGHSGVEIWHNDSIANGVITNNQFIHNYKGIDGQGYGYGVTVFGEGKVWMKDPKLGTSNFIFIENNHFDYHRHSIGSGIASRYVFRYNVIEHNIVGGPYNHAIDTHPTGTNGGKFGSRASEIYSNIVIGSNVNGGIVEPNKAITTIEECAIAIKSGDAVVYNNTITGFRFGTGLVNEYMQYPENVTLYCWNNKFTSYNSIPVATSIELYNYRPEYYIGNRDYFEVSKPGYIPYKYPY